jgi:hypothetical protein
MRIVALVLGAAALLAGCGGVPYSDPYGSPDFAGQAQCERIGGHWHGRPAVCESPLLRW